MTAQVDSFNNPHLENEKHSLPIPVANGGSLPFPLNAKDYFFLVFVLLLESMQVRQSTVMTESKEISMNASIQNQLNELNAAVTFVILPSGAGNPTINEVNTENQEYAALRENFQNSLITARQNAQVMMTQTSTNVNLLQQDASKDTGVIQMIQTIFQVINEILSKR
jgi:hypothetical protein